MGVVPVVDHVLERNPDITIHLMGDLNMRLKTISSDPHPNNRTYINLKLTNPAMEECSLPAGIWTYEGSQGCSLRSGLYIPK